MSRFFNKIQNTGKSIFQKAQGANNHLFNKILPSVSQGLDYFSDKAKEYGRKIGNSLEKNVGGVADAASGALTLMGQPQYAQIASSVGNFARVLGGGIKKGAKSISNVSKDLNSSIIRNSGM
jgi:hypothetical protein